MSRALEYGPNATLIGESGSRAALVTPALVLDLDQLEANIAAMASHAHRHGYMLRPTAKIHKSTEIARLQLEAGNTLGVCCAILAEAEAMVDAGIPGVLLFTSVTGSIKVQRLAALNARADGLLVAVDDRENALTLATSAREYGNDIRLVVDYEVGGGRTGIQDETEAVALAQLIAGTDGAVFAGVQGYSGRHQRIVDFEGRREATLHHGERLVSLVERLDAEGLKPAIVSTGGTGTHAIEAELGVGAEVQVGSYVFMDLNYLNVVMRPSDPHPFAPSLFVQTTVISAAQRGFVVTDAGVKEVDGYLGPQQAGIARGASAEAKYSIIGDDMGRVDLGDGTDHLSVGDVIELIPPHSWQTAAMYPAYHCIRGETLVDIWPVEGRNNW